MKKDCFNEMIVYDFSNLDLQQDGNDNCYFCDDGGTCDCDSGSCDCNNCDACDCNE
jgi:hypothetical protein